MTLGQIDITDVAPTILWLMDIPLPEDVDGRVPREIFEVSAFEERPIRYKAYE